MIISHVVTTQTIFTSALIPNIVINPQKEYSVEHTLPYANIRCFVPNHNVLMCKPVYHTYIVLVKALAEVCAVLSNHDHRQTDRQTDRHTGRHT